MKFQTYVFSLIFLFSTNSFAGETGVDCIKGAGSALKGDAVLTGVVCVVDIFFTAGMSGVCAVKVAESITNAPIKMAVGCGIAAALDGEGNPVYEAAQTAGNISSGIDAAKSIGEVILYAI